MERAVVALCLSFSRTDGTVLCLPVCSQVAAQERAYQQTLLEVRTQWQRELARLQVSGPSASGVCLLFTRFWLRPTCFHKQTPNICPSQPSTQPSTSS